MTDVKRHFSTSADSLEITTDIENRVAEMFTEILEKEGKQVIVEQDVRLVIEQMGTVADFEPAEDNHNADSNSYAHNRERRRLFRDPDDHLVAGVCSGIANYFGIDPVWVRLAFAVSTPLGGSGILLYIILWCVVPKAATRADRMAMKGEKQNLQGFKKNFEDELSSVRDNISNLGTEARPFIYKARDFFSDFFHHLGIFFKGAGNVLIKLIGVLILVVCFSIAVALVIGFIVFVIFKGGEPTNFFPYSVVGSELADNVFVSAFVVAFIPVLSIILVTIKGIFKAGNIGRSTGSVFLIIWLCALGTLIYYASRIATGFRESASINKKIELKPTANNTYYLKLNDLKYFTHDDSARLDIKNHFSNMIIIDDENDDYHGQPRNVTIYIEKGDVKNPVLEQSFSAKGGNYESALFNATNTTYIFTQQDSVLKFDYTLRKRPNISWHDEEVTLTLKVPLNSKLVIDERLHNYLRDVNIYECKESNKQERATSAAFIMTDNGLQCKVDTLVIPKKDSTKTTGGADSVKAK
jgi:phage shock protein PspC (stress-responsive transcriptional regulator)